MAEFAVSEIHIIHAEVKLMKLICDGVVVDVSANQFGGLAALGFLEEVNAFIGKGEIFKRSIVLIKAWGFYEGRLLGAHHALISTYALETLVLYILNRFHKELSTPLEVLHKFLVFFADFDWDKFAVSVHGPVPLEDLHKVTGPIGKRPEVHAEGALLTPDFMWRMMDKYGNESVSAKLGGGADSTPRPMARKYLNVVDPLLSSNNLGRSVSQGNAKRIRKALALGAQRLTALRSRAPAANASRRSHARAVLRQHHASQAPRAHAPPADGAEYPGLRGQEPRGRGEHDAREVPEDGCGFRARVAVVAEPVPVAAAPVRRRTAAGVRELEDGDQGDRGARRENAEEDPGRRRRGRGGGGGWGGGWRRRLRAQAAGDGIAREARRRRRGRTTPPMTTGRTSSAVAPDAPCSSARRTRRARRRLSAISTGRNAGPFGAVGIPSRRRRLSPNTPGLSRPRGSPRSMGARGRRVPGAPCSRRLRGRRRRWSRPPYRRGAPSTRRRLDSEARAARDSEAARSDGSSDESSKEAKSASPTGPLSDGDGEGGKGDVSRVQGSEKAPAAPAAPPPPPGPPPPGQRTSMDGARARMRREMSCPTFFPERSSPPPPPPPPAPPVKPGPAVLPAGSGSGGVSDVFTGDLEAIWSHLQFGRAYHHLAIVQMRAFEAMGGDPRALQQHRFGGFNNNNGGGGRRGAGGAAAFNRRNSRDGGGRGGHARSGSWGAPGGGGGKPGQPRRLQARRRSSSTGSAGPRGRAGRAA